MNMSNIVYLIGDKGNGRIFDIKDEYFSDRVSFQSFMPCETEAKNYIEGALGDYGQTCYVVVEATVEKFVDGELHITYDTFKEDSTW
jgi:hypothetical protein